MSWVLLFFCAAPAVLAQTTWQTLPSRAVDQPGFVFTASPPDWRDIPMYHVITDRFYDGDPANNDDNPDGNTNPFGTTSIHGGDFEGLEKKLDYIQMLGKRAVWISPVQLNVNGSFHGYAARDFNAIDPHWGTLQDLRNFIDAAHRRGIYVIIDVVQNHLGDLADSTDSGYPAFRYPQGYNLRWRNSARRHAPPFDNLAYLHNYGNVGNWEDTTQSVLGDFMGLDGIRTENAQVRQHLITIFKALISATDCDGFRVDTARHIEMDFWEQFLPAMYDHAASLGKTNFIIFAEAWRGADEQVAAYTATNRFNSALYFPMRDTMEGVFVSGNATRDLNARLTNSFKYAANARNQLVNFLDNHDMPRRLTTSKLNRNQAALQPALTFLYTSMQIPCLYYGTEQAFDGAQDPYNREDMFDGDFEESASLGDNFNMTHPLFRHVRKLNLLRDAYPALKNGDYRERWVSSGRGIFAFTKTNASQKVFVAFNTATNAQTPVSGAIGPQTTLPNGTVLVDVLGTLSNITVGAGGIGTGQISFTLPAYQTAILVPQSNVVELPPSVVTATPAHDAAGISRDAPIVVDFDQPMNTASVQNAFRIFPGASGTFTWTNNQRRLLFTPQFLLAPDTEYNIRIETNALSASGRSAGAAFEAQFFTGQSGSGVSPLGNYVMDGVVDPGVPQLVTTRMMLYAQFDRTAGALYLATFDAGEGNDHFIFIDDNPANGTPQPIPEWNKIGTVAADGPFLADENDNDFTSWYRVSASAGAKTGLNGGVMEGVINLYEQYGTNIQHIYLALAPYGGADGGSLQADYLTPASINLDQNIDAGEFLKFNLLTGVIEGGSNTNPPGGEIELKQYVINGELTGTEQATLKLPGALPLYADFNGELLYVATVDAGEGDDHFIMVTDQLASTNIAPWAKAGQIIGRKHFLADENDGDFSRWFINNQMDSNRLHAAATPYNNGGYLEGTLNLTNLFGTKPERLYLAVVPYATTNSAPIRTAYQNPSATITNSILEATEYYVLELASFDTDGDGIHDLDEDTNRNGVVDPGETNPRRPDSDGDGIRDGDELLVGGDPLDARVAMRVETLPPAENSDAITFDWYGLTSHLYRVLYKPGLMNTVWQPVNTNVIRGVGGWQSIELNSEQDGYFRLEARPE